MQLKTRQLIYPLKHNIHIPLQPQATQTKTYKTVILFLLLVVAVTVLQALVVHQVSRNVRRMLLVMFVRLGCTFQPINTTLLQNDIM